MSTTYHFNSCIGLVISRYLKLKIALGRQYIIEHNVLKHLDSFLYTKRCGLTTKSFLEWCHTHEHLTSGVRRSWMRIVRNLCIYRQRTEPLSFIPDKSQFPTPHQVIQPHIFTKNEIVKLLNAIKKLQSNAQSPIRQENFRLALILLYTSGLRRGELCRLIIGDYNPNEHTLLIRESKFHKSRLIPLSHDGWSELETYLKIRRRYRLPITAEHSLIWNCNRNRRKSSEKGGYTGTGLWSTFNHLFKIANIKTVSGHLPRLHDLRHTFAVHALLHWYSEGIDAQVKLPYLSIYMGHVSVVSTQYYLHFIEEVIDSASERFAKHYSSIITISDKRGAI
jgi:integrase/recombinase XerD